MKSFRSAITALLLVLLSLSLTACLVRKETSKSYERILQISSSAIDLPSEMLLEKIEVDYAAYLMEKTSYDPDIDGPFLVMNYYGSYGGAVPVMMGGLCYADVLCEDTVILTRSLRPSSRVTN